MTDDGVITNRMLLEHMQARFDLVDRRFGKIDQRLESLERKTTDGFAEARRHREMLQEDLDATIRKQAIHDRKLAMVTGEPLPEDFD